MSKTILVVDDEPIVLQVTTTILQNAGYVVKTAASGEKAVALCEASDHPIDLLLTDVGMPRMNSEELARCLVSRKRGFPVMFMGSDAEWTKAKEVLTSETGMDGSGSVEKPFTTRQLLVAVEQLLERSEADRLRKLNATARQS